MKLASLAALLSSLGGGFMPSENAFHRVGGAPPQSRGGHTGIPAARRVKRKQRNIASKR